ncbi:MAG: hypothetical protein JW781_07210 [Deltaproteobacteria bacterium]|nr:hypothetical protein [Candidatus Anaeroferrophillacea bacterium]
MAVERDLRGEGAGRRPRQPGWPAVFIILLVVWVVLRLTVPWERLATGGKVLAGVVGMAVLLVLIIRLSGGRGR